MASIGPNHKDVIVNEDLLRHMVLNSIRVNYKQFKHEYGQLVIASDHKISWRRQVFQNYKANRRKTRQESPLDWKHIFECLSNIREELKEYFHYPVIHVEGAEADDIISVLAKTHALRSDTKEDVIIISGDKDFGQLHYLPYIKQFDPVKKRFFKVDNPTEFLLEHIIRGDSSDGIPNILSDDDCFVNGIRQKPLRKERVAEWVKSPTPDSFLENETMSRNYYRNETLIDLTHTPVDLRQRILEEYNNQSGKRNDRIFNYFIDKQLRNLMETIGDFA